MASGDILGIGISGLLAFQRALATAGHNIANANTEGYSRQRVEFGTRAPQYAANGYIGTGVQVDSVRRLYDAFLNQQVRSHTSSYQRYERYYALAAQVDNLLADSQGGLNTALREFFDAVHDLADNPASGGARQVVLSQAEALAERFHVMDERLDSLDRDINAQIRTAVGEIERLAVQIADLNRQIATLPGQGADPPANDLLDERERLVTRLAEYVAVTTVSQDNGALNVFIGSGQALVIGDRVQSLSITANEYEASRYEIGYAVGGTSVNITNQLAGAGTLGAALAIRAEVLDPVRNALGRIAIGLAATFNAQHALGLDLDGNLGGMFFSSINASSPVVSASRNNTGTGVVSATVTDAAALTASDYLLERSGATYTLTRLSDGTVTTLSTFPGGPEEVDGITLSLSSGVIAPGDRFLIRPTRSAAGDFDVYLSDPRAIAAAAPLIASSAAANTGSGKLTSVAVTSASALPLFAGNGTITLSYDSANQRFAVTDSSGLVGYVSYDPSTDSGTELTLPGALNFITVQVTGTPSSGDSFTIADNTNGEADNRNALRLAGLESERRLAGATASYAELYGQLVADVGTRTQTADTGRQAQQLLLNQAVAAREAVSGVNLDEEAADLVRLQQAYQAAAQVIAVADTLFQTLLYAVRR